jgi:cytochrome b561
MKIISTPTRYGAVAQLFHWVTVGLVGAGYLISSGGPESRVYSPERATQLGLHETIGMCVIAVLVLRLLWKLIDHVPQEPEMPAWMLFLARLVHWILYALLAAIPLTAILGAWYEGHSVTFLGVAELTPLVAPAHAFGQSLTELHTLLGNVIIWVAGFHAAAALLHHFILRDRVLLSMLPFGRIRSTHLTVAAPPAKGERKAMRS